MDNIKRGYDEYAARQQIRNEEISSLKKNYDLRPKRETVSKIRKPKKDIRRVRDIINKIATQKITMRSPVSIKQMKRPTVVIKARPYHSNFFREEFSQGGQ